jgi:hypothetical protein
MFWPLVECRESLNFPRTNQQLLFSDKQNYDSQHRDYRNGLRLSGRTHAW